MTNQTAEIEWRDTQVPVSTRFDDPYFSVRNGLAESRHVFLSGNDLPARFTPGFHIAELGFGTGLNALAAWYAWRQSGQPGALTFTSFEKYPMAVQDMRIALAPFTELAELSAMFFADWRCEQGQLELPGLQIRVITGDARNTLTNWTQKVDAWFLDGFSPAKNPELWTPELMALVAAHTVSNGTFATYTAAGHVRRALQSAGFSVARLPGFDRKRHMTAGELVGQ